MKQTTINPSPPVGLNLIAAAHLLGMMLSTDARVRSTEDELRQLKLVRAEDAKANERVVGIFASHEQSWFAERRALGRQIRVLSVQLQSKNNENALSSLSYRITEAECEMRAKDDTIAELEKQVEELRQDCNKHKEMADQLSDKIERMQVDAEQKDKVLSALLRKSKIDAAEKQKLLKEMKLSKAQKKQAELEAERWRSKLETRQKKAPTASYSVEPAAKCLDQYSNQEVNDEAVASDMQKLKEWVRLETDKCGAILEQKHFTEIEAFMEQMRLKDEKVEAMRWRLLSKDIESRRLQSQVEALEDNLLRLREALLLGKRATTTTTTEVEANNENVKDIDSSEEETTTSVEGVRTQNSWKMDIQALGVSYKIKRLKQQLLMLEKLAAMKQTNMDDACSSPLKGLGLVIHLLNKQVQRFQSLEEKTDSLCRRIMEENNGGGSWNRKERSRVLERFLEETFQLQRYMVATGQKLMEIQGKITGSVGEGDGLDETVGFNEQQFADVIRTLFRDIQRGLELRIARIIGDLEGTLACDGIRHI